MSTCEEPCDHLFEAATLSAQLIQVETERDRYREALGRYMSGEDSRAQRLRLKLFQMRDSQEVTRAAGYTLRTEAKARLYDIQQDIIRAAIAADDSALASGSGIEAAGRVPRGEAAEDAKNSGGIYCPACDRVHPQPPALPAEPAPPTEACRACGGTKRSAFGVCIACAHAPTEPAKPRCECGHREDQHDIEGGLCGADCECPGFVAPTKQKGPTP